MAVSSNGGFARRRGQAKSSQANQVHATPGQSTTTLLQSITLISPTPDDRQPAALLPCCLRHVVPPTFAALLLRRISPVRRTRKSRQAPNSRQAAASCRPDLRCPMTDYLPRSSRAASGTWFHQPFPRWLLCRISPGWRTRKSKQSTDASRSHQSPRTIRSNRPISRRCLPPAAQFCQPLPITISLATSPPRRTSPVLTYRQRTHYQPLLAKCCPTQLGRCRLQSCSRSANKAHLSCHGSSSATACLILPGAAQPLSITILPVALPTRRTSPVLTFG